MINGWEIITFLHLPSALPLDIKPEIKKRLKAAKAELISPSKEPKTQKKKSSRGKKRHLAEQSPEKIKKAEKVAQEEAKDPSYNPRKPSSPSKGISSTPAAVSRKRGRPRKLKLDLFDEEDEEQTRSSYKRKSTPGRSKYT